MNDPAGTYTVLSCADSVLSMKKLSKVVPALKHFSDALSDWADGAGAALLTTKVHVN